MRWLKGGNSDDIVKTAQNINAQIRIELSPDFYKDTLKTYTSIIQSGCGKCDDRSTLVVMALRSVGIPAAFELIPYWGSSNNGHSFASMILPDDKIVSFQNDNGNENNAIDGDEGTSVHYNVRQGDPTNGDSMIAGDYFGVKLSEKITLGKIKIVQGNNDTHACLLYTSDAADD